MHPILYTLIGLGFALTHAFILGATLWATRLGEPKGYVLFLCLTPMWVGFNVLWLFLWFRGLEHTNAVTLRLLQALSTSITSTIILYLYEGRFSRAQIVGLILFTAATITTALGKQ